MISILRISLYLLVLASVAFSQDITRDQKIRNIFDLRSQISVIEKEILQPDTKDLATAQKQGFSSIRLLPREKYDSVLAIRGGGAYYSFVRKTHEYGRGSDIALEQGHLSVGFAGADYGLLMDLGEAALADISKDSPELDFLIKYTPPTDEPTIRAEQRKSHKYEVNGLLYQRRLPWIIGHTYILRSIGFSDSDVLVAFTVQRKDSDGSLIIFWKLIETFVKPEIRRDTVVSAP